MSAAQTSELNKPRERDWRGYMGLVARGFCMGASDVVPGVSGGTMAFILGIYEELVNSIRSINISTLRLALSFRIREIFEQVPWKFLLAVLSGILLAVFSLAQGLEWLLENEPVLIWSFFFGLILASVLMVSKRIETWNPASVITLLIAAVVAFLIVGLVPTQTTEAAWFTFLSGAIAICAMILPGISGSFILVLLGKYQYILGAVNDRDFVTLAIFAAGAAIGILTFAQFLGWLFKRYHDLTIAALTGFMLGSLRAVWPWKTVVETTIDRHGDEIPLVQVASLPASFSGEVVFALALAAFGFALVFVLERLAQQQTQIA